jgi:16S rRNA processing protein RimM
MMNRFANFGSCGSHNQPLFSENLFTFTLNFMTIMIELSACRKIGKLGKPNGKLGYFNISFDSPVYADVAFPETLFVLFDGYLVPFFIDELDFSDDQSGIIKFDHINTPEATREFVNCEVFVTNEQWEGMEIEWENHPLDGFKVIDQTLGEVGVVSDFIEHPSNPLLECTFNNNIYYIPFNPDLVIETDYEKEVIITDLPEGLIELNS